MARKNPSPQSKGAFGWNTTAYANFNTPQKIIFWLWPIAMLNYVFVAYWFVVFLGNRKKPLEERRETYVKALYYYNIFWLCVVAIVLIAFAFIYFSGPAAQACDGFYCESRQQFANDERCENTAYVLGDDDSCHPPCGAPTQYCDAEHAFCFRNECVSCPAGTTLYNDGNCYE
jgi:hypothetical protein